MEYTILIIFDQGIKEWERISSYLKRKNFRIETASTDENPQEEVERGEDQATEEGLEQSGHEEELTGEGQPGEDYQSPEEELLEEEHQSPEEEQYIPDPQEGRS